MSSTIERDGRAGRKSPPLLSGVRTRQLGSGGVGLLGVERSASHSFNVTGGHGAGAAAGRASGGILGASSGAPIARSVSMAAGIDEATGGGGKLRGGNAAILKRLTAFAVSFFFFALPVERKFVVLCLPCIRHGVRALRLLFCKY